MEREIKLRLLQPKKAEDLLKSSVLAGLVSKKPRKVALEAVYYDTTDHQLLSAGFAYRIRKEGRQWVATLKDGGSYRGGLHERQEWNVKQKTWEPNLDVFKESGLAKEWKNLNGKKLTILFEVTTQRHIQELTLGDGTVVEMAIDTGRVFHEGKQDEIHEVELELLSGSIGSLLELAALLSEVWGLAPERRTKFSRGLALAGLNEEEKGQEPIALDDELPAPEGVIQLLIAYTADILSMIEKADSGYDRQWIYDFRVEVRELRSLLALGHPFCPEGEAERWIEKIKECYWETGALREMDVLEELLQVIPNKEVAEGELSKRIRRRRKELVVQWEEKWGDGKLTSLFLAFWSWLEKIHTEQNTQEPYWTIEKWSMKTMSEEVRELWEKRREDQFDDFKWTHDLRVEAKELRYSLAALSDYLPIRETSALLKGVEKFQEKLGRLQDSYCSTDWMNSLKEKKAPSEFYHQVGIVKGWLLRDAYTAKEEAEEHWEKVIKRCKKWLKYVEG